MARTKVIGWSVVLALLLGGCGVRHLNHGAKMRLDTVGVVPSQYLPLMLIPPAPDTFGTALGQNALHYGRKLGSWGTAPLVVIAEFPSEATIPVYLAGIGLSVATSTVGAAYGSVYTLLHPPIDPERARQCTLDLNSSVKAIDFQQEFAAAFLAEMGSASKHRFALLSGLGQNNPDYFALVPARITPGARLDRRAFRPFAPPAEPPIPPYHESVPDGTRSVLELSVDEVQFTGIEKALTLHLSGKARLLMPRRNSASPAFRAVETLQLTYHSDPHPYQAWGTEEGALLRTRLADGWHDWSDQIRERWFY